MCISYNMVRKPCSAAVHGGPTAKELPGRFTVVLARRQRGNRPPDAPNASAQRELKVLVYGIS